MKMGPQASKMSPRAPKITQNHESDHPKSSKSWKKNQENPRKKEGTVAVYARSALDNIFEPNDYSNDLRTDKIFLAKVSIN